MIYQLRQFVVRGAGGGSRATINADDLLAQATGYRDAIQERDKWLKKKLNHAQEQYKCACSMVTVLGQ